jgi:hypothetical protein
MFTFVGVNQSHGGYYKRLHEYFNEHKREESNRSQIALQNCWAGIQRAVSKFCGYKSAIDRRNESGKNEHDRVTNFSLKSFLMFFALIFFG